MIPFSAGRMNSVIELQTATAVQSDSGEEAFDWANAVSESIWAQWLPAGTREATLAQQRFGSYVDGVFRIYDRSPRPAPDATRILFEDKVFDVKPAVQLVEHGRGNVLEIPVVARGEA